jgi:hypothetical protein
MVRGLFRSPFVLGLFVALLFLVVVIFDGLSFYLSGLRYASRSFSIPEHHLTRAISYWRAVYSPTTSGLPTLRVFIKENDVVSLMSDPPISTKNWKAGKVVLHDGQLRDAKIRLRGDNFRNWGLSKKSWRIKLSKNQLPENKVRSINLVAPRENVLRDLIPYLVARKIGVAVPHAELVEVVLNERPQGIALLLEHTDENFLRNSGYMPVGMYKAEPDDSGRAIGVSYDDLFSSRDAWRALSTNNNLASPGSDLRDFIGGRDLPRLLGAPPQLRDPWVREWARFAAFQELVQSWHNSRYVNQRIIFDEFKGVERPIAWDTTFYYNGGDVSTDQASNPIIEALMQEPIFLFFKRRFLKEWLIDQDVLLQVREEINGLLPALIASLERDPTMMARSILRGGFSGWRLEAKRSFLESLDSLEALSNALRAQLDSAQQISWRSDGPGIDFFIGDKSAYADLRLSLVDRPVDFPRFFLDRNSNHVIDGDDLELQTMSDGKEVYINALWAANRIAEAQSKVIQRRPEKFSLRPTKFSLLSSDSDVRFSDVHITDPVFSRELKLQKLGQLEIKSVGPAEGNTSGRPGATGASPLVWQGRIEVQESQVISRPVIIWPGTDIRLGPGVSLVFLDKVTASGSADDPIFVRQLTEEPWGSFVLQGQSTSSSTLRWMRFSGGSGTSLIGRNYTSMLALVDTTDVLLSSISLRDNRKFDDALRVVYSTDILIEDIEIKNAFSDGIDFDLSSAVVKGGNIVRSGNDGIDLMGTRAVIEGVEISQSGDKGISVGEESQLNVNGARLTDNKIGIESKDGSEVIASELFFADNATNLNAYKKNWRYNGGGKINIEDSTFSGIPSRFTTDPHSSIVVKRSAIPPFSGFLGNVIVE